MTPSTSLSMSSLKSHFFYYLVFLTILSAPSVEIDGSLADSDGLKEAGSKKRYTMFYYPFIFIE